MARLRGSSEGFETDVMKALDGLDALNRRSDKSLCSASSHPPSSGGDGDGDGDGNGNGNGGGSSDAPADGSDVSPQAPASVSVAAPTPAATIESPAPDGAANGWTEESDTRRFVSTRPGEVARPSDRRAARRVVLEVPVSIHLEGEQVPGTSEDISVSGIFVQTARLLHSGKRVRLRFDMPSGLIEVVAVVVRFRTPSKTLSGGVGLCFDALSEAQRDCIDTYCDSSTDSLR
jgi:hypothetical protein